MGRYIESQENLQHYVEKRNFEGYDPYDVLRSPIPFARLGKWPPVLAIQVLKRLPLNIRPILGVPKGHNPKALGLFLKTYSESSRPEHQEKAKQLFGQLLELRSKECAGYGWGYDFPWASPAKFLPAYSPTIVVTGFIAQGIHAYYKATSDPKALEVLNGISAFMLELPRTENENGICFSYSTTVKDVCFNASMLGAEHFARMYALNIDGSFKDLALSAANFTVQNQATKGMWPYSLNENGKARQQIDFHQGFVLCSLLEVIDNIDEVPADLRASLITGAEFYRREQFTNEGRSLWRWPKKWPTDIHHQAQGIITFSRLSILDESYLGLAERIATWTLENMQAKDGSFYYRVHRWGKDRTRYMRWGQAWMLLALHELNKAKLATRK